LWVAFLCTVQAAEAQKLIGTRTVFHSDHHSVTIERYDPPGKGSRYAVMVVHGGGGPEGGWRDSRIIEVLVSAGYSVFVPHYFEGSGGKWDRSMPPQQFLSYVRTLNDASRYMAEQTGIQRQAIGLVGLSLGGYLVLTLAEESISHPPPLPSPDIKAVVEFYGAMPEFAAQRMTTMPPVLIVHGELDEVVPVTHAYTLETLLKNKGTHFEMKIYPGQKHGLEGEAITDANRRTVSFLQEFLVAKH
jgi:dipeptidyl aminopeptidase/acylaminoacyl peptidase